MAVSFPPEYPLSPPEMRFITPILHCNVNSHGKICHSIFDSNCKLLCPAFTPSATGTTYNEACYLTQTMPTQA